MSDEATPGRSGSVTVRPRAWAIFVDGGNARMWSTLQPHVQKLADAEGLEVTPLYDRAAIDAAVAAERVQIAARIREAWHQREASHGNRAGEYHEGMLAGLDAAVALALGPNASMSGPQRPAQEVEDGTE